MTVLDPSNWGMTTLSPPQQDSIVPPHTINVRIENAGEYITSLNCAKVALIKIDVEGHEAVILASMREWLSEVRPPVILFECHHNGPAFREMEQVRILSELGYEFLGYNAKLYWHTRLYAVTGKQRPAGYDFVAVLWHELDQDCRIALEAMVA